MPYQDNNFDIEQIAKKVENSLKQFHLKGFKSLLGLGALGILLVGAWTSFYTVEPDEEAVIMRLGRYATTTQPGLHFKLPLGIDNVIKVKTRLILQEEFGFRTSKTSGTQTSYSPRDFEEESLTLTGDLNVANVEWVLQYQIADPQKYLFNIKDPIRTIRDASQAVMRRVVGDRVVNEVLTIGRIEIAEEAQRLSQEILNKYDSGIRIVTVKLQDVNPPEAVKPSFNDVNAAKQEQEKDINMAEELYNKVIPEARGKAEQELSRAEGYAVQVVNHAKGDAGKFKAVLIDYRKAPEVTRKRLYLETMEEIFKKMNGLTIVDEGLKGLLPIFETKREIGKISSQGEK